MGAFDMLHIAGSGLNVHQTWLDELSHNIANANTVRSTDGPAFQAQYLMVDSEATGGVRILFADIEPSTVAAVRTRFPFLQDRR